VLGHLLYASPLSSLVLQCPNGSDTWTVADLSLAHARRVPGVRMSRLILNALDAQGRFVQLAAGYDLILQGLRGGSVQCGAVFLKASW
jgi:hypothetical protein